MQDAINNLRSDNERKNSKKILVDMLEKAVATDLIAKNVAKQITTENTREDKKPRRVLSVEETELFLAEAEYTFELHPTKTNGSLRDIPLTTKAVITLKQQLFIKKTLVNSGKEPLDGFENLVFVTKNNRPTTQFLVNECIKGTLKRMHKNIKNISHKGTQSP